LPERWSVQRKTELVLRLVRGEGLDAVSRNSQIPAHELERWQRIFVEQGKRGLRTKAEPEERELILARAKIGELMMRLELAEDLIEKDLSARPLLDLAVVAAVPPSARKRGPKTAVSDADLVG
jgi:transposase